MPQIPSNDNAWSPAPTETPEEYLDEGSPLGTPASMGAAGYSPATTPGTPRTMSNLPLLFQWSDAFNSDGTETGS